MADTPTATTKRKVLYVITKSNFGGAQRYVYDLACAGAATYDVAVAFGGTGERGATVGDLETRLHDAGIRTIRIRHFMRDVSLFEDIRAFGELVRLIRSERPDVLHVTSSKAGGLGALAGRIARTPRIVFTSHGLVFEETWRPIWQRALLRLFTWCTMALAHATIQISQSTYDEARAMPFLKERVHLIYNGIAPSSVTPRAEARTVLAGTTQPPEGVWVGTVAELHPNKNLGLLIEALGMLHAEGTAVHAWIIGEGEERTLLQTRARDLGIHDRVHFAGYVQNAARLLSAFDIFVLPSKKEGLPYVLLEAGHAGCAVVASDIRGNNEIVEDGVSGILVPHDAHRLAEALTALVRDPARREQYGAALKARVARTFSVARMHEETRALYDAI